MRLAFVVLVMAACAEGAPDPSDGETDTEAPEAACVELREGEWAGSGSCFGMFMSATLTVKAKGCRFTFSEWNMSMNVPDGGVAEDGEFTLTGFGWEDCSGTAEKRSLEGTCESTGCVFEMSLQ